MKYYRFNLFLFSALSSGVCGQTLVYLGSNEIKTSMMGLSLEHPSINGSTIGENVSFDLSIEANNESGVSLSLSHHPDGIGVIGGSYYEIDNRNNLDPDDDESLTFELKNVQGLAEGQSLRISAIGTRSLGNQTKQYQLSDSTDSITGSFSTSPFFISVPNQTSVTLSAIGPTTGSPVNSKFIVHRLVLSLISESNIHTPDTDSNSSTADFFKIEFQTSGKPYLSFQTVNGKSYEVQSVDELTEPINWTARATVSGSGETGIYIDDSPNQTDLPKRFYRVKSIPTPNGSLSNTTLKIEQTWAQEPNGYERTADVIVPDGQGPHPVVIMLHGNGGDSNFINSMGTKLNNAIRVAPNGYLRSWNVDNEASKAPDVAFIQELITLLRSYENVDAGKISIYGSSNGSGMTNRLLIELDGAFFQRAAGKVSQMITKMYHDGSFWYNPDGNNNYDEPIMPARGRSILMISGDADPLIPYTGGNGVGTSFMDAQESIYRLAQAMGETGAQLADEDGIVGNLNDTDTGNDFSTPFVRYSYLDGQVVHYKLIGGNHGLQVDNSSTYSTEANQIIAEFLVQ